ncbi:MAG: hypothetical protein K2J08_11980 [Ruminococcus sp.]|nr:hypothetical protein [Ruminococcus sp.]
MNIKILAVSVLLSFSLLACGDKKNQDSYESPETSGKSSVGKSIETEDENKLKKSGEVLKEKYRDVPSAETGPVISISDTAVSAGGTAEVTVSVKGADMAWNMCGIHVTFPDELKCVRLKDDKQDVKCKKGEAVDMCDGFIALEWIDNKPDELINNHLGSLFFTAMFEGDSGQDGEIATFYFDVPEDAESGTVYPIGYYFMQSDMFRNLAGDASFEKYAFENWQTGSITVK